MTHETPSGFVSYEENEEQISMLSDEEAGQLYKALYAYSFRGEEVDLPPLAKLMFSIMKQKIDRDRQKYCEKLERNRENGAKGGRPKKTAVVEETQENPPVSDNNPKKATTNYKLQTTITSNDVSVAHTTKARPSCVEDVEEYRHGLGYTNFNAQAFFDFYEANGWVQGKNKPIKDWKAAVRNWQRTDKQFKPKDNTDSWMEFAMGGDWG